MNFYRLIPWIIGITIGTFVSNVFIAHDTFLTGLISFITCVVVAFFIELYIQRPK